MEKKETYRLHTIDLAGVYTLPRPLPTVEEINNDKTTFIGPWLVAEKIDFFEDGKLLCSKDLFDIACPVFCAKVKLDGIERDALYKPSTDVLTILDQDIQP